jgi:hypothetical protein
MSSLIKIRTIEGKTVPLCNSLVSDALWSSDWAIMDPERCFRAVPYSFDFLHGVSAQVAVETRMARALHCYRDVLCHLPRTSAG